MIHTLAIHDEDLEAAKTAIAGLIRRTGRNSGGYCCVPYDEIGALADQIIQWISERQLSVMVRTARGALNSEELTSRLELSPLPSRSRSRPAQQP